MCWLEQVGDRVAVGQSLFSGTVRFVGFTTFADGVWVGVELHRRGEEFPQSVFFFLCIPAPVFPDVSPFVGDVLSGTCPCRFLLM